LTVQLQTVIVAGMSLQGDTPFPPESDPAARTASLIGTHVMLRPIDPHDYIGFYWMEQTPGGKMGDDIPAGSTPPEAYEGLVWDGTEAQFAVTTNHDGSLIGRIAAQDLDLRNGHARLHLRFRDDAWAAGWVDEAATMFVSQLFETFPLFKVYWEHLPESSVPAPLARFAEEGRLRGHVWRHDGRSDLILRSVTRDAWLS